ncbi:MULTISPECIES: ABC transporter permease [unclassified Rhodanobacter]|uniref:ABC transporter permease n=1 Tax=unclassified Rhodanobacter TaxID=2621553 RepID=UPI00160FC59D|nr:MULTISPECIES: ABC transporter permease [unclassified Rhodanobacter]MBB6244756.1 putative ABC transport system permease protein [Rhodanobacter sp. MP1X3]MBB6245950.1 putative ABC transport system permease protein [Rhodanobacter sp. A1T4]
MVALARKTLVYEWRRFLPAILAVGFAGLLQLLQLALVLGIFGSTSLYITGSSADVWIGYPGTQSVGQGRSIDGDVESRILMDPAVQRVEPYIWVDGDWRGTTETGGVSVFVSGIDPRADGLMFSKALPPDLRARLAQPDAVVVDRSDLDQLGVGIGQTATINGHEVRVVGISSGLRALGGVNVLCSLDTARRLDSDAEDIGPTYLVAKLRDPTQADAVAIRLRGDTAFGPYTTWSAHHFARLSVRYWMFDTGAGAGVLFLAGIVFLVGAVITSQTLIAAVNGSVREYATLNALGVGVGALRRVVLEQAFWVGALGLLGASVLGVVLLLLARSQNVPVVLTLPAALGCIVLVMGLAAVSGLAAMRSLRAADPATLLR